MARLFKELVGCDHVSDGDLPTDVLGFLTEFWTEGEVGEMTLLFLVELSLLPISILGDGVLARGAN